MITTADITQRKLPKLHAVVVKYHSYLMDMHIDELSERSTESSEKICEAVDNLVHYYNIQQRFKNFSKGSLENIPQKDLLDLADTYLDLTIHLKSDKDIEEVTSFSNTLISLTNKN